METTRTATGDFRAGPFHALAALVALHGRLAAGLSAAGERWLVGLTARTVFAATLLLYFWNSALTKISDGLFGFLVPSVGAYAQILPKVAESVSYDVSQIGLHYKAVVLLGTWAEFILPLLIVVGLFTRLAALGMIGFIAVQSIVDVTGHGAGAETIGALFDRLPDAAILDQRLLWAFVLVMLVIKGAGALSLDGLLARRLPG